MRLPLFLLPGGLVLSQGRASCSASPRDLSQSLDNPSLLLDTWNQQGARQPLIFPGFLRKHALYYMRLEELQGVGWLLKRRKRHHSLKQSDDFSHAGIFTGFCLDISDGMRIATTNGHIMKPTVLLDLA